MLDKENFDWDTLNLEEFNYEGNANLYLNLTSSFTQKELTFNSNYITLKSNSLILDKVTFNNDLLLNDGLKGNFKSKIVEFKKDEENERTISIGPSLIYATKIIIGSRNIDYDEIDGKPCFYPLDENGITIINKSSKEGIMVNVDTDKMLRVFENLLTNAIKYSYKPGKVIIGVYKSEKSAIVAIKNKGQNIPKEKLDRLFDRFYRVDEDI